MDFAKARINMVDGQLMTGGVIDRRVLQVFGSVPRERFLPPSQRGLAYLDMDVRLAGSGRYLMEATPLARLVHLAAIVPGDVVLEVGCASGYGTMVLSKLGGSVVGLESDPDLASQADRELSALEVSNAAIVVGPLEKGWASEGPYDAILIAGSVEYIPDSFCEQLKEGGRLVAVIGTGRAAQAVLHIKIDGVLSARPAFDVAVPPLPGFQRMHQFAFPG
jgi:protein-L-isoaspartate(D-aspartate) O-methyltransferase